MDAARHWARAAHADRPSKADQQTDTEERLAWGLSEQDWEAQDWTLHAADASPGADLPPEDLVSGRLGIWPQNWPAVEFFWAAQREWLLRPDGMPQRMDKCAIQALMQMRGVRRPARLLAQIQLMESAAMEVLYDD